MSLVVNLFAGPGAGKSSLAYGVTSDLKHRGINAELSLEFAKDLVWQGKTEALDNQFFIFGTQLERLKTLERAGVDIIVTDSPILLSAVYKPKELRDEFIGLVLDEFNKFNNMNFFVERTKPYFAGGRVQTEAEAKKKDKEIKSILKELGIGFIPVTGDVKGQEEIFVTIMRSIMPGKGRTDDRA